MSNLQSSGKIEEALLKRGIYVSRTEGVSMEPMLRAGRDTVIIKKAEFPLKKYDIPVYSRNGKYIMHRIVKATKSGYVICGDNCVGVERDITDEKIIGILAAFYRGDEYIEYGDSEYMRYAKQALKRYRKMRLMQFVRLLRRALGKLKRMVKKQKTT